MRVLTTTLCYPTPARPDQGLFVQRRALALAARSPLGSADPHPRIHLRVLCPLPRCPVLRPSQPIAEQSRPLPAAFPTMLSVPVVGWAADGLAYARALERAILAGAGPESPRIDLIDAHFVYPDGVGAWRAGRRLGIPVVVTVRGKIVSLSRRAIRRAQIAAMLRGVDARIAVSESLAEWVRQVAGSDLSVDVIPNGVDPNVHYMMHRDQARSLLGWHPRGRYVLAVGHLQKLKGFDRIVSVMPAVRAALGDVRLVLVGSRRGEALYRRKVHRLIARCNDFAARDHSKTGRPSPCIRFLGPMPPEKLNLMYNAADLVASPSRSEGWSNAIAESLAVGTPVVATAVGGNPEQICSSELGTIVPDGDERALTEAVAAALSRQWNRPLIAAHGSARTWKHVADEVYAVFARVLAARPAGARERAWTLMTPATNRPASAIEVLR